MTAVGAVVLAAGRGQRFGAADFDSKLVVPFDGRPLIQHAVSTALASRAEPVIVVLGHAADTVATALTGFPVQFARNPDYRTGLASSLRIGAAAVPHVAAGVLFLLGDMPLVLPKTIDQILARFERDPTNIDAVVPRFTGRQGNPALIGRNLFDGLQGLKGDQGARNLLSGRGRRVVFADVEDEGVGIDVDTPETLRALIRSRG